MHLHIQKCLHLLDQYIKNHIQIQHWLIFTSVGGGGGGVSQRNFLFLIR
jgi:hypothetical protein